MLILVECHFGHFGKARCVSSPSAKVMRPWIYFPQTMLKKKWVCCLIKVGRREKLSPIAREECIKSGG